MKFVVQLKSGGYIAPPPICVTDFAANAREFTDANEALRVAGRLEDARVISVEAVGTYCHEDLKAAEDFTYQKYRLEAAR